MGGVTMFYNPVLTAGVLGWAAAQVIKFILYLVQNADVKLERLYGSGGMPSSHSSLVCAAFVSCGRLVGWDSPITAAFFVFGAIVMYDAANVRLEAGKHAKQLNEIMQRLLAQDGDNDSKMKEFKELLGHTPLQVVCGAILGILIGAIIPLQ
ncbi:MAG: divergent PAP2 family protein [Oscillospiraceae bacterium]|nr:divergent PAP2 family protein [Oscillospiraceae bacterium]